MSEKALQIAEKRREAKVKGENKRYTNLKAEFQRTVQRNKKTFLNGQCKEIEENNRMGKTRDLFRNLNFQIFKLDLEKAEESEIKLPTSTGSLEKQENSRKTSTSAPLTMLKPLIGHNKLWKILSDGNIRPPYPSPEKPVCRSRSNS